MNVDPALRARLQQLLAAYGTRVRTLVASHNLARYGVDGADIEQEVLIRLWRALEREPKATFNPSYIQTTVLTTTIDAIRAVSRKPSEPLPDEDIEGVSLIEPTAGPEQIAINVERMNHITGCVEKLPERRRAVVELHLEGFTTREIGEAIGTSSEAARKLLDRGLITLREWLSEASIKDIGSR